MVKTKKIETLRPERKDDDSKDDIDNSILLQPLKITRESLSNLSEKELQKRWKDYCGQSLKSKIALLKKMTLYLDQQDLMTIEDQERFLYYYQQFTTAELKYLIYSLNGQKNNEKQKYKLYEILRNYFSLQNLNQKITKIYSDIQNHDFFTQEDEKKLTQFDYNNNQYTSEKLYELEEEYNKTLNQLNKKKEAIQHLPNEIQQKFDLFYKNIVKNYPQSSCAVDIVHGI